MKRFGLLALLIPLASCGPGDEGPPPDPIVVYAPQDANTSMIALFAEFTDDTRIQVSIKWGSSVELTDALINKTGVPADILIADNVADIWRAADEGALRPTESARLDDASDLVRDRDGYWVALEVNPAVFITPDFGNDAEDEVAAMVENYEFCVLSSQHSLSRSYIANSIQSAGLRQTERGMRRMVAALQQDPFETQDDLVAAVRDGRCPAAIVANPVIDESLQVHEVELGAATAKAVGIGRHSRYPDSAQCFVDWVLRERTVDVPDSLSQSIAIAGYRDEEARLLAERAGYR